MATHHAIRILLCEDETVLADVFERMLGRLIAAFPGATVTRVESLWELKDIVRGLAPDVTILDLTLRDVSREATVEEIKSLVPFCPVVVITGASDPELRRKAIANGASDWIYKPDLQANPGLLEKLVTAAITAFKITKREGLSREIEALRRFAETHGPEA